MIYKLQLSETSPNSKRAQVSTVDRIAHVSELIRRFPNEEFFFETNQLTSSPSCDMWPQQLEMGRVEYKTDSFHFDKNLQKQFRKMLFKLIRQ